MRLPCLILAPFYADRESGQILNIARATTLARLALAMNMAPVMRHATHPLLFLKGDNDADALSAGRMWSETLVDLAGRHPDAVAWLLETDDGKIPHDVDLERRVWCRTRMGLFQEEGRIRRGTWASYGPDLAGFGLQVFHQALEASTFLGTAPR